MSNSRRIGVCLAIPDVVGSTTCDSADCCPEERSCSLRTDPWSVKHLQKCEECIS
jgi:hypothetical protein